MRQQLSLLPEDNTALLYNTAAGLFISISPSFHPYLLIRPSLRLSISPTITFPLFYHPSISLPSSLHLVLLQRLSLFQQVVDALRRGLTACCVKVLWAEHVTHFPQSLSAAVMAHQPASPGLVQPVASTTGGEQLQLSDMCAHSQELD